MTDTLAMFERFRISAAEVLTLRAEFEHLVENNDLSRTQRVRQIISEYKKVPGIYFWTIRLEDRELKIYIGKTNSLGYRAYNYTAPFQPHSPNDFKIQVFRNFIFELAPSAQFNLYFARTEVADLNPAEKAAISKYKPLLNMPRSPTSEAKEALQTAFADFYRSSFEGLLRNEG